jgi:hypothetical protein
MEIKDFKDYNIAEISKDELQSISDLEQSISSKSNKDIILIAYQCQKETNDTK